MSMRKTQQKGLIACDCSIHLSTCSWQWTRQKPVRSPSWSRKKMSISREQLPMTPAYAFTDYRAQAQIIEYCVVDIGLPPYRQLTPFNAYIALSHSRGRNTICLLHEFDECLFTRHPSEHLQEENIRLQKLNYETKKKWEGLQLTQGVSIWDKYLSSSQSMYHIQ